MSSPRRWKAGDRAWVKTGISTSDHEELCTIVSVVRRSSLESSVDDNNSPSGGHDGSGMVLVKMTTSGYEFATDENRMRPMERTAAEEEKVVDGRGRTLRRSGRRSTSASAPSSSSSSSSALAVTVAIAAKKIAVDAGHVARVTPSSTEIDSESPDGRSACHEEAVMTTTTTMTTEEDSKPKKKRKRGTQFAKKALSAKKAKSVPPEKTNDDSERGMAEKGKESPYFAGCKKSIGREAAKPVVARRRKLILASSEEEDDENVVDDADGTKKPPSKNSKRAAATAARARKRTNAEKVETKPPAEKSIAATSEEEEVGSSEERTARAKKRTAAAPEAKKRTAAAPEAKKQPAKKTGKKKPPAKRKAKSATSDNANNADTTDGADAAVCIPAPLPNRPDGNGGLNQPTSSWLVEYSPTGRATCRTCDERIKKGDLRAGNKPLFRGKPGFMVYRHLRCVTFSSEVREASDVSGYESLTEDDHNQLVEQVERSADKRIEEEREVRPDELVQKAFEGEMRGTPVGFEGTLLPFQLEGFSWMRHQEREVDEIRGGILADEMGMGKTIQTIATMLDNRPKLQHATPNAKHPPACTDLPQRQAEEILWNQSKQSWCNEMDTLKVSKKLRSKDGGARAGTLVICPVIALSQWKTEIEKFTEYGTLTVGTYHGSEREREMPREMMRKYDVVLTTYQVLESDFRKMTSPNRVECPNCGGKFKIDKLPIHLKYFCGDAAQRTEAQSRQVRNSERDGGGGGNCGRRRPSGAAGRGSGGEEKGGKKKTTAKKTMSKKKPLKGEKEESSDDEEKKPAAKKKKQKKSSVEKEKKKPAKKQPAAPKKKRAKKPAKKAVSKKQTPNKSKSIDEEPAATATARPRAASSRSAARQAASRISSSASEWAPGPNDDDDDGSEDGDNFRSDAEPSSEDESDTEDGVESSSEEESEEEEGHSSDSSEDSALERAREKQRQALEASSDKSAKKRRLMGKKKPPLASKAKGRNAKKKPVAKGKKKKFDDDDDGDYSSDDSESDDDGEIDIDMKALVEKAMAGAKNSVLHSVCWWRIILDEAHFIKTRSSQTANAAFSLIGIHRWCLSGTPLQNRVGEFYSLVRFLRLDPMAYYFCRCKDCDCKSLHYRIVGGICEACGHGGIQHYSHFNKYILNPIQRDGYSGDGRRAMFLLKNEVLDKALLRRTKEMRAADMELPPRLVRIKPIKLHPVEEDFYSALYTQTKSSFNDYVDSGTLLNNYAHIFDLLIRMRQSVDHPYLVVYSKKNMSRQTSSLSLPGDAPAIANGSVDCDLCHEPPTDRVVSTCCGAAYCRSCVLEYMATSNGMASASAGLTCPSCGEAFSIDLQARADIEDDSSLNITPASVALGGGGSGAGMPSLKELKHVATGSILRRINLAEFATSSKIEALTRELVLMRQTSPGSKAIVFSQFVNMLDLIRWRLHSDPYLEDIGLGCRALHGGMNVKARDKCLKDFREDNNVRVLLMSLKAGGVALNLTCANYIYLMDPWWNPAAEMQAIDRTHRLGQYRPIRAVRFIAEDTVEERILQLQEKKRLVFDGTVGRDAGSLKMLTVDDMKSLFA